MTAYILEGLQIAGGHRPPLQSESHSFKLNHNLCKIRRRPDISAIAAIALLAVDRLAPFLPEELLPGKFLQ